MEMTAINTAELNQRDEAKCILIDAIKSEDQDFVRAFEEQVRDWTTDCLMACLQQPTLPTMLELLLSICDPRKAKNTALQMGDAATQLASPEYLKLLLQHEIGRAHV